MKLCTPLTDSRIKQTGPGILFDGDGLCLYISATGRKTWKLRYKVQDKYRKLAIGTYPNVGIKQARTLRMQAEGYLAQGLSIRMEGSSLVGFKAVEVSAIPTFKQISEDWFGAWSSHVTTRHAAITLSKLQRDVFPEIGHIPVNELNSQQVLVMLRKIETSGRINAASRANVLVGQVIKYSIAIGHSTQDPRASLSTVLKKPQAKHFPTIEIEEIPQLLSTINQGQSLIGEQLSLALKLLLLTLLRVNELVGASWSEYDEANRLLVIPKERMKARVQHIVPISDHAGEIIAKLKDKAGDSPWILPASSRSGPIDVNYPNKALYKLGYKGKLCCHGLRSLGADLLISKGYALSDVDAALAHTLPKVQRAYFRRVPIQSRRKMFQDLGQTLVDYGLTTP